MSNIKRSNKAPSGSFGEPTDNQLWNLKIWNSFLTSSLDLSATMFTCKLQIMIRFLQYLVLHVNTISWQLPKPREGIKNKQRISLTSRIPAVVFSNGRDKVITWNSILVSGYSRYGVSDRMHMTVMCVAVQLSLPKYGSMERWSQDSRCYAVTTCPSADEIIIARKCWATALIIPAAVRLF